MTYSREKNSTQLSSGKLENWSLLFFSYNINTKNTVYKSRHSVGLQVFQELITEIESSAETDISPLTNYMPIFQYLQSCYSW